MDGDGLLSRAVRSRGLIVALLVAFWLSYLGDAGLSRQIREARRKNQPPIILNGQPVNLRSFVDPAVPLPPSGAWTVVALCSDRCPQSSREVELWSRLFAALPFREGDRIVVLSAAGRRILEQLLASARTQRADLHAAILTDEMAFKAQTGLGWTPATVVLDDRMRVRGMTDHLSTAAVQSLAQAFAERELAFTRR